MVTNIGSGIGSSLGIAAETTYGTYVAPDHFYEFNNEDLKLAKTIVQGGGLAGGRYVQLGSRRVFAARAGGGSFTTEVQTTKFGLLLQHIAGTFTAPVVQGATTAYLMTADLGDTTGKSLSVQKGVPQTDGTVVPYTFLGSKVTSAEFSCAVQDILTCNLTVDSKDVVTSDVLAAPSYPTTVSPFHGGQMVVKLGTHGSETQIDGITKIDVKFDRPLKTDRFYAGSATPATKSEPILNGNVAISGTLSADFLDRAVIADLMDADTSTSLVIQWTGAIIESTYHEQFTINVPMVFFDTDTPTVGGPDVVSGDFAFTGQYDGTNSAIEFLYQSTDATA